jgi:hypothetical protein
MQARPEGRPLSVAVIGSVAGDRGRGSNFIYGAAKAVDRRRPEIYAPGFWRLIMLIIRHLPRMVLNRMKI